MQRLADTCADLGFVFAIHDQYRDYYLDAASYDERHTLIEDGGKRPLHALGNAGLPYVSLAPGEEELRQVRTLGALHRHVGLLEMTTHRFLDAGRRRQEFSYADGTRVTIDLQADTWTVAPELAASDL
jgi:hypothetical protein